VTLTFAYSESRDPAAPVLPLRIGVPHREPGVTMPALVDSGADMSVVPEMVARQGELPLIGSITVGGVGGVRRHAPLYAAQVEVAGIRRIVEVIGLGQEALIGRDLLNNRVVTLDGPARRLHLVTTDQPEVSGSSHRSGD
jgi:hypothetical protein